jgi:hypothetical protein
MLPVHEALHWYLKASYTSSVRPLAVRRSGCERRHVGCKEHASISALMAVYRHLRLYIGINASISALTAVYRH